MNRGGRKLAYEIIEKSVLECIKDEFKDRAKSFIEAQNYLPEYMLYTHLGRGDLIRFDME